MIGTDKKIDMGIPSLNVLFRGGLYLPEDHTTIMIVKGGKDTERGLFGLQLIYRLGLELGKTPQFLSDSHTADFVEDILLDVVISSCIKQLITMSVQNQPIGNLKLADLFFDTEKMCSNIDIKKLSIPNVKDCIDQLLTEEIAHYSNRTNALHIKTFCPDNQDDNRLFERRYNKINDYFPDGSDAQVLINQTLGKQCGRIDIKNLAFNSIKSCLQQPKSELIAVEVAPDPVSGYANLNDLIVLLRDVKQGVPKPRFVVFIVDDRVPIPDHMADILIHLYNDQQHEDYLIQRLRIEKCDTQGVMLGAHQYKRRDYGIEIYPSLHTYFLKHRYLERALIYTHSDVITDTFQQYLDYSRMHGQENLRYRDYDSRAQYLEALFPSEFLEYTSEEVLNKILLEDKESEDSRQPGSVGRSLKEIQYGNSQEVTGIIGDANTYKRFLSFGSMFSSAINENHTMIVMLNQETPVICRRLICPACIQNKRQSIHCKKCLEYVHFMNFCIGCITPDEFIYYLKQQLETPFRDGKHVKRIIFDNLQIIDFCFPFLKESKLFLPALMSLCREKNIALYILCDKSSESVPTLRALADNIICAERSRKDVLQLYVERFARYNFSPSKIYCAEISPVDKLFECSEIYSKGDNCSLHYALNPDVIEDAPIYSMESYWKQK